MRKLFHTGLTGYKWQYLRHDALAALVVAAISVPESLGFAVIAGLPPVTGLYTALLAPIVFGLVASTRRLVVGADSATAALVASGALLVAQAGTAGYGNAVAVLGLLTALILLAMAAFRLGFLADLISRPVLVGFLGGVGVQLIINKLPDMLGITASGSLWQHITSVFTHAGSLNGMAATISVLVVGIILLTRKTRIPGELIGLVAAIVFALVFHVQDYGVKMVGALPAGLPSIVPLSLNLGMLTTLFPAALSIALVILAQSSAVVRSLANEHDEKVRLNHDLTALGLANAVSALTHGFAVNGSPPRSAAADAAGGRTSVVNVLMGLMIGALLLFGSGLLTDMPLAALASIVFVLGFHLIRFQELRYIWSAHRIEFAVAMIALVGTALFGVYQGVVIAVIVSLMERLSRQYHPKDDILLRDGTLSEWAAERLDWHHHRHRTRPAGLLISAFDGSLFFENVNYFVQRVKGAIDDAHEPVEYVLIDAGAIDSIDYTAVETIKTLFRQLGSEEINMGFAHVSPDLRRQFDSYGVTSLVGVDNIFSTLSGAIKMHPGSKRSAIEMVRRLGLKQGSYVVIGGAVLEVLNLRETNDVDIVVSDEVYTQYRDHKHWAEYVQDNGKKVLSHDGYNLMHTWMGSSLKHLMHHSFEVEDVTFMSVDELIEAKRHLGRKKDLDDIMLLENYRDSAARTSDA
jgi:high affinity sulfate transporter 1